MNATIATMARELLAELDSNIGAWTRGWTWEAFTAAQIETWTRIDAAGLRAEVLRLLRVRRGEVSPNLP